MQSLTTNSDGEAILWKTPYNHDRDRESIRTGTVFKDPSLAQQHARDETDINNIVDKFLKTGTLPNVPMPPSYENFGEIFDFQSAMNTIKAATDSFLAMPANLRARFDNDPAKFVGYVDHCMETGDLEPLEKLGLAIPRKAPEPPKNQEPPAPPRKEEPGKEPPSGSKT